ncbi:hypothetical protein MKX07_004745 [Trichoderma sp. CBMAI-0711]|nr:hypothetical protein MKX07_004745 [Trichoderma sp. CBMAI-0711]
MSAHDRDTSAVISLRSRDTADRGLVGERSSGCSSSPRTPLGTAAEPLAVPLAVPYVVIAGVLVDGGKTSCSRGRVKTRTGTRTKTRSQKRR